MFLFLVFIMEYLAGEVAFQTFDGWFYFIGGWCDLNVFYYLTVASVDVAVVSIMLKESPEKDKVTYAALATTSFFANAGGLYVYIAQVSDVFYLSVMQTILVLKLILIFNRTISHVTIHARDTANSIVSSVANSLMCLYVWEVVKTNKKKRWVQ